MGRFERVLGRCNDYVQLSDGAVIHSEVFSHALRDYPAVDAFQVVIDKHGTLAIHYVSRRAEPDKEVASAPQRLARIHPELAKVRLVQVERLEQTVAGKTRMVRAA